MKNFLFQFTLAALAVWVGSSLYITDQKEWFIPFDQIPNLFKVGGGVAALALSRFIPTKFLENFKGPSGLTMPQPSFVKGVAKAGLVGSALMLTPAIVQAVGGSWDLLTYVGSAIGASVSTLVAYVGKEDKKRVGLYGRSFPDIAELFMENAMVTGSGKSGPMKRDGIISIYHTDQNGKPHAVNLTPERLGEIVTRIS